MWNIADLEELLERPLCPSCRNGCIRPVNIRDGKHLRFECPSPRCRWDWQAQLPKISKRVIYLDTSTVSHMARALSRGEANSPWAALHRRLQSATAAEVICCPVSSILESEAELSRYSDQIVRLAKEFGDPGLNHETEIQEKQIFRTLDRFLAGQPAILETNPSREDAFEHEVDHWLPVYAIHANIATPTEWIHNRRTTKTVLRDELEQIYKEYAEESLSFEEIRQRETGGFGRGIIQDGERSLRYRLGLESLPEGQDSIGYLLPTSFDRVVSYAKDTLRIPYKEAFAKAGDFFLSEHAQLMPVADIGGKLHAALAVLCRGVSPRLPRPSDSYDISHLATHLPYFDIFICDSFFADLCNQKHLRLADLYGCEIRSLGPNEVPSFIHEIDALVEKAPQAQLADRIAKAIEEGGFHQEFAERAAAYLRARGVKPYANTEDKNK